MHFGGLSLVILCVIACASLVKQCMRNKKEVLCFGSHCISVPSFVAACSKEQPGDFASHHCASCDLDSVLACLSGRSDDIVELVAVDSGAAKSFVNKQGASLLSGGLAQSDTKISERRGGAPSCNVTCVNLL